MSTIAERHNLERGDICEIVVLRQTYTPHGTPHRSITRYGRYMFTRGTGEMYFDTGREPYRVPEEQVRTVRKVSEEYVARQFHIGKPATVRKYGSDYSGRVTAVKRTRVEVEFTTNGGKVKRQVFPAWQVQPAG